MGTPNAGLDALRHLFSLAVILIHIPSASRYSPETLQQLASVVDWIDGAVLGFFVISGFLSRETTSLRALLGHQAKRLLLPFLVFSIVYGVLLSLTGKAEPGEVVIDTLMLRGPSMQLYFLPYLFVIAVACAALVAPIPVPRRRAFRWGLLLASGAACWMLPTGVSTGPAHALIPFYAFGYLLGQILRPEPGREPSALGPGAAVLFMALAGWQDHRFLDALAVVLLVLLVIRWPGGWPRRRLPGSGGIYLLHTPFVVFAVSTLLLKAGIGAMANVWMTLFLSYGACGLLTCGFLKAFPKRRWLLLE